MLALEMGKDVREIENMEPLQFERWMAFFEVRHEETQKAIERKRRK
jgi:hypothetical protein